MTALTPGDPVPWFSVPSTSNPTYYFDTTGGYRTVLFFFGSSKHPQTAAVLQEFCDRQSQFALLNVPFFGISIDPDDVGLASMIQYPTYCKFLWDFDQQVSTLFGVCQKSEDGTLYAPTTFVVDERLRVLKIFPWEPDCLIHPVEQVMEFLQTLPALSPHQMAARQAPVLMIPQVLEPELCRTLIDRFEADGGRDSGFMQEHEGKTVEVMDYGFKKRRDFNLENAEDDILQRINQLVIQRVKPEIERAFQFSITRFERYLVACYDSQDEGFFNRHRDNTTKGTAHRRFAMTINLNTPEYEGGCLWFPEYGPSLFRPQVGEAIIFSCSLLHEVTPVVFGKRYALLSFFYDDAAAQQRQQNQRYLAVAAQPNTASKAAKPSLGFSTATKKKRR